MLYERWCSVAKEFAGTVALTDAVTGKYWTFRDLRAIGETGDSSGQVTFPTGNEAEFVFAILRAWRQGKVTCPLEPGQSLPPFDQPPPRGVVHLKTTSATGGLSRMVAFTAGQLAADADGLVAAMGLRQEWPNLGIISLSHSYGFSNLVLPLLLHGIPLVLVKTALPEFLKRASAAQTGVTIPAVPALWRMWLEAEAIPPNVCLAISAGAPLPLALEQKVYAEHGMKIHNFYGSSECGGIAYDDCLSPRSDGACVGRIISGVNVRIGPTGCVEVRGAAVGERYWPEQQDNLREGVFRASDLGEIRKDFLFLSGRVGDMINVAGRKILPEVIERALAEHPGVKECVVFGIPSHDGHRGESIVGCLATEPGITAENLRRYVGDRLPAWQVPREWWFVDSLPANGRGKISRTELRNRYLKERR